MPADERKAHWENVYSTKDEREVSWYEYTPALSLKLIRDAGIESDAAIVDVGGGASRLVDGLVAAGQTHLTVLDLSASAIETAKARVGDSQRVNWIVDDVTAWAPQRPYDLWHDRAAFHFLTEEADRQRYVSVLKKALRPAGVVIIGTFAPDGPEKCSGLPVARYNAEGLRAVLGKEFELLTQLRHSHVTPWGAVQHFQFVSLRRTA